MSATTQPPRILKLDDRGLYCPRGGFHVDPWQPVEVALLTHAHSDHAREGNAVSFCTRESMPILRQRLGPDAKLQPVDYGQKIKLRDATVSFHPAGHILGSAQVRVEVDGCVWVVSGDYKRAHDPTCAPFEVVPCDVFITEATFALPIYRWDSGRETAKQVLSWWDENIVEKRPSVLFCYSLGKAQRLLAELYQLDSKRQVYLHGATTNLTRIYREQGIEMLATEYVGDAAKRGESFAGELILAPPSAFNSTWMKRFKGASSGFASGWMRVRGTRRRKGYDRGFVLSDHADWYELVQTVKDTGATTVLPTHGSTDTFARYLNDIGVASSALELHARAYGEGED